jgi:hypothetical protein
LSMCASVSCDKSLHMSCYKRKVVQYDPENIYCELDDLLKERYDNQLQ